MLANGRCDKRYVLNPNPLSEIGAKVWAAGRCLFLLAHNKLGEDGHLAT